MSDVDEEEEWDKILKAPRVVETISVQHLLQLKKAFAHADVDGNGTLNSDEFAEAFGTVFGEGLSREQLLHLFMKIDANSDGTVDWDEFSTFMLMQDQVTGQSQTTNEYVKIVNTIDKQDKQSLHTGLITGIHRITVDDEDQCITVGQDGHMKTWRFHDFAPVSSTRNGKWAACITDSCLMEDVHLLAVASIDRRIRFYDYRRWEKVSIMPNLENTPICLTYIPTLREKRIFLVGDDCGRLSMYEFGNSLAKLIPLANTHYFHNWVTKSMYIAELDVILASSLDDSLKFIDPEKKKTRRHCVAGHNGIRDFDWCRTYKFVATCGTTRDVHLFNPYTLNIMSVLTGHNAPVQQVIADEDHNQLITMACDKTIKIWDVRTHGCIQTIVEENKFAQHDTLTALIMDRNHSALIAARGDRKLDKYQMKCKAKEDTLAKSHDHPVCKAIYNLFFNQVVSGDAGGYIHVWDLESGDLAGRWLVSSDESIRVSAMAFDKTWRRLITAHNDGTVNVWNYSTGQCIFSLATADDMEVTDVIHVQEASKKFVCVVGWNRKVTVYEDAPGGAPPLFQLEGHHDDILCMAFCPPNVLATGSYDGYIIVWNVISGYKKFMLKDESAPTSYVVQQLLFLQRRSNILVAAGDDGCIRFWSIRTAELLCVHENAHKDSSITALTTDRSRNKYLVSGDGTGVVKVWDLGNLRAGTDFRKSTAPILEQVRFRAHSEVVTSIDMVERHNMILTASEDMTVSLFTLSGKRIALFGFNTPWNLSCLKEGENLLTGLLYLDLLDQKGRPSGGTRFPPGQSKVSQYRLWKDKARALEQSQREAKVLEERQRRHEDRTRKDKFRKSTAHIIKGSGG